MKPPVNAVSARDLAGVVPPALLVVCFGLFLHPMKGLALVALVLCMTQVMIRLMRSSCTEIRTLVGLETCRWRWIMAGATVGIGLAMLLRFDQARALYPFPLHGFLFMAMLVGATEELLFRGYFMGGLLPWNAHSAAVIAAVLHTAYKVSIFVTFADSVNLPLLGSLTFIVGMLLGYGRIVSRSIWPCVAMHVLFDLWVYGDRITPWWVW